MVLCYRHLSLAGHHTPAASILTSNVCLHREKYKKNSIMKFFPFFFRFYCFVCLGIQNQQWFNLSQGMMSDVHVFSHFFRSCSICLYWMVQYWCWHSVIFNKRFSSTNWITSECIEVRPYRHTSTITWNLLLLLLLLMNDDWTWTRVYAIDVIMEAMELPRSCSFFVQFVISILMYLFIVTGYLLMLFFFTDAHSIFYLIFMIWHNQNQSKMMLCRKKFTFRFILFTFRLVVQCTQMVSVGRTITSINAIVCCLSICFLGKF